MKQKLKTMLLFVAPLLFLMGCDGCGDSWHHVSSWNGAFFIDDTTIGAIGSEYDIQHPTGSWDGGDVKNYTQSLYYYDINKKTTRVVKTFQDHDKGEGGEVHYVKPWLVFCSSWPYDEKGVILYNTTTGEEESFKQYSTTQGVSSDGRYVFFGNNVYDRELDSLVYNTIGISDKDILEPFYVDNENVYGTCDDKKLVSYDINLKEYDTLRSLINDKYFESIHYTLSSGEIYYYVEYENGEYEMLIEPMISFINDTKDTTVVPYGTPWGIDTQPHTGSYLYLKNSSYYLGNYKDKKEEVLIFESTED